MTQLDLVCVLTDTNVGVHAGAIKEFDRWVLAFFPLCVYKSGIVPVSLLSLHFAQYCSQP